MDPQERLFYSLLFSLCAAALLAKNVQAHETPIALLTINERQAGIFNVEWTYSSSTNQLPPTPVFPAHCEYAPPLLRCGESGFYGELALLQLGERYSAAVIQITRRDSGTETYTLTAANPAVTLTPEGRLPWTQIAASYVPLGFEHIVLGIDHLLFVLGLMLLVNNTWMLIKTITSFTIAHSITLAAATLGWLGVPEQPVNAAIALSIVFVAVEVIKHRRGEHSLSARFPWAIAFGFGLLHGFGFAGALSDIGLATENLPAALLFFNVGVELGQIAFVLSVIALLWCHRRLQAELPTWGASTSVYGMGAIAAFWFIARVSDMVNVA